MLQLQIRMMVLTTGLAMIASAANAITITLDAVQDTTVIERPDAGRTTTNNGSLLQVWNNDSGHATNGRRRSTMFQFDLSSVGPGYNIVGAHLEFYDTGDGDHNGSNAGDYSHETYVLRLIGTGTDADKLVVNGAGGPVAFDKDGMHEVNVTYNTLNGTTVATPKLSLRTNNAEWSWDAGPLSSLDLALDANNAAGYYVGGSADADALEILNEENINRGYILFQNFWDVGGRTFGDYESGNPIRLVLDVVPVPEPGAVSLAVIGIVLAGSRLRKRGRKLEV